MRIFGLLRRGTASTRHVSAQKSLSSIKLRCLGRTGLCTMESKQKKLKVDHSKDVPWMELNSDKTKATLVRTSEVEFQETYSQGVYRKMIERLGGEVARCTTVVKYDPNRVFPRHTHSGGEEFIVLDGVWRDDYGKFPKYSYLRNYIGSSHQPEIGEEGCQILVKLRQMSTEHKEPDNKNVDGSPDSSDWEEVDGADGVGKKRVKELFSSKFEKVTAEIWPAGSKMSIPVPEGGKEVFVVDGAFESSTYGVHDQHSWTRLTFGTDLGEVKASDNEDLYLYIKEGHFASPEVGVDMSLKPKDWKAPGSNL